MTTGDHSIATDDRILIFAPVGKDGPLTLDVLQRAGLNGTVCGTAGGLCEELDKGAAAIVLTEEALEERGIGLLMARLRAQPAWSDVPILLFADAERSEIYVRTLRLLEGLRNVILLERPIRLAAALSLIRSAIRGRHRQYELRDLLNALEDAREQAETANRLKDEFLATLSHELRTPLNAILGWTAMLKDGNVPAHQVMRAVETIHRNATAQVQIVNDLLDTSRIVRGSVKLSPKLTALGPLVALAVESITPTADARRIHVMAPPGPDGVFVWADPDRLQQVLWNLLTNAVKFTPAGGRVHVTVTSDGADACVRVTDTGKGISADFLPHVFERFRQADGSSTRTHGGLGLGLAIVRHLVELHGGRLTAESRGEGSGSTFAVYLPVRGAEQRVALATTAGRTRPLDLAGIHVLIVDDERDARELLTAMIAGTGARISEAASVDEALQVVRKDPPGILVADLAMPGQDGYALMRSIRGLPDGIGLHMRALAVSAYARHEDKQRALEVGYNDHLGKPVQPHHLLDVLRRLWSGSLPPRPADADSEVKLH